MVVYPAAWHSRPTFTEPPRAAPVRRPGLALVLTRRPDSRDNHELFTAVAAGLAPVHRPTIDPQTRALLQARASLV